MINFYNKGLDRLVPNRPAPGQSECQSVSTPARFAISRQAKIESQLSRLFSMAINQQADLITEAGTQTQRELAQMSAYAFYLAIAPQVRQISPRADRKLTRLLTLPVQKNFGERIKQSFSELLF